jgi:hypothetical protein
MSQKSALLFDEPLDQGVSAGDVAAPFKLEESVVACRDTSAHAMTFGRVCVIYRCYKTGSGEWYVLVRHKDSKLVAASFPASSFRRLGDND